MIALVERLASVGWALVSSMRALYMFPDASTVHVPSKLSPALVTRRRDAYTFAAPSSSNSNKLEIPSDPGKMHSRGSAARQVEQVIKVLQHLCSLDLPR